MKFLKIFLGGLFFVFLNSCITHNNKVIEYNNFICEQKTVSGGEISDGKTLKNIRIEKTDSYERIIFDIYETVNNKNVAAANPPKFFISLRAYPYEFFVTIHGIRRIDAKFDIAKNSDFIKEIYMTPFLDDSGIEFSITLTKPVQYKIYETHNPAQIVIVIKESETAEDLPALFSVRTKKEFHFEELGHLTEDLKRIAGTETRILKSQGGFLIIEAGKYNSREEAEKKAIDLNAKMNDDIFTIEKREKGAIPF